jgi:5-methylthioadenosine/S-adenosylhomocysteine deaminase
MAKTTCIKNCDCIVAWDPEGQVHAYLMHGDLAFSDDRIVFVGSRYENRADETIDGKGLLLIPGLINTHSHPATEPFYRGIREEQGVPQMYMTGLYERLVSLVPGMADRRAGATTAYCELLLSGVTTVADLSAPYPGWMEVAAQSGLRVFLAPGYASAQWVREDDWRLKYRWDEPAGKRRFRESLDLIDQAVRHPSGRLSGIVFPTQIDTCTEELLRDSHAAAEERGLPFTTHCAQSVNEFNEMVYRHGKTPIQWADEISILSPHTILGHAVFLDEHSWLHWHTREDLTILARNGTSVAHCPSPFARYGQMLEDFGRYVGAGVNMSFGTDVSPHNLLEEMRLGATLGRIAAEDINAVKTAEIFTAATVGGARALRRDDLGKLAPGYKADIVAVDLRNPYMLPGRDPLRSLIYHAADRAVRDVFIDGIKVVNDGEVVTLDHAAAAEQLIDAQMRMEAGAPSKDHGKRTSKDIAPLSLPQWQACLMQNRINKQ